MTRSTTRRQWLKTSAAGAAGLALSTIGSSPADAGGLSSGDQKMPIKVVVWDEQQPAQKEAYENFLGNQIAAHLKTQEGLAAQSVKLGDPEQGLSPTVLNDCRVLIWWGHVRNSEVAPETAKRCRVAGQRWRITEMANDSMTDDRPRTQRKSSVFAICLSHSRLDIPGHSILRFFMAMEPHEQSEFTEVDRAAAADNRA